MAGNVRALPGEGALPLPSPLPGFAAIERYLDGHARVVARIGQGGLYVTYADEWLATTLGSCVAVCLRTADGRCGGMNHVVLPGEAPRQAPLPLYHAPQAVAQLVRQVVHWGRQPASALQARVYGGAGGRVGEQNVDAVLAALARWQVPVQEMRVGGARPHRVVFHPRSGAVEHRFLDSVSGE